MESWLCASALAKWWCFLVLSFAAGFWRLDGERGDKSLEGRKLCVRSMLGIFGGVWTCRVISLGVFWRQWKYVLVVDAGVLVERVLNVERNRDGAVS